MDALGRGVSPMLWHTASCILQIVGVANLINPRSLLKVRLHDLLAHLIVVLHAARSELRLIVKHGTHVADAVVAKRGVNAHHVLVQLGIPAAVVAPEEVGLSVVVDKDGRVDIPPVARDERTTDGVNPRSFGTVGNSHTDAVQVSNRVLSSHIPIPFAIALYCLTCPRIVALLSPLECGCREDDAVVLPVLHVLGGENLPVGHAEVGGSVEVVTSEDIERLSAHHRSRVGRIGSAWYSNLCLQSYGQTHKKAC